MCGRARLSTDYSETRIKLKFDPDYPAPNIPASWNVCPTDPMLVAVRSQDGKRIQGPLSRSRLIMPSAAEREIHWYRDDANPDTLTLHGSTRAVRTVT
jgi:putative SOS response-associated peptidase YedK